MLTMTSTTLRDDASGPDGLSPDEREKAARNEQSVRRGFWTKIKATAARIPFAEDAVASYYAAFDRKTPLRVRATLMVALAYFVLPLDVMPDIFPIIGFTDDAAVLMAALKLLSGHVTPDHYTTARDALTRLKDETD
ncbi:YkvA family protein [Xanthobacter autotrophicus]|jgi:uncharacterized membrane protein YkvA (DUF1232 family)|uniref:DUF1232 domain-containing protein n=1 Tax=Xanthobacter autotrophicus TaxID=280 RepID=A0A6C1KTJ4_XANAU|nr:YkvA family protein [Xanthobacter autotrophicus]TLX42253.1 DUF1232 domain-containing protein [Xanthobacter autotrophicus]